ncbi:hypothetical protein FHL15_010452 [Xylaria flabelliformis]|uniref:Fe2OG dioxygenase domain-containing protein n=1 Tax=Xylaria flabelliformis TaxID=2512241 RepID=A0A553HL60_9PEZI|nr:hypothetical protein FHL15_010452 [Xylaria flabelliformis]
MTMSVTKLKLRTALGPVYRDVLPYEPRDCTPEEIPVIDLQPMFSSELSERKKTIARCKEQILKFMKQPLEMKELVESHKYSKFYNGYLGRRKTQISPSETVDVREGFTFRYSPDLDPDHPKDISQVPDEIRRWIRGEDFVWEGTQHLPEFKRDCVAYWSACLRLARKMVRMFALSLDLEEDYWDEKVTHPGADGVFNYYPARTQDEIEQKCVGLGSHTDLQLFTLLWQDSVGGLQILTREGQWIKVSESSKSSNLSKFDGVKAPPIEGTIVVNIGDYMMRLCNDIYKSTVHRVTNESTQERVSMPFFFGCQKRFQMEREEFAGKEVKQSMAPSAVVVAG